MSHAASLVTDRALSAKRNPPRGLLNTRPAVTKIADLFRDFTRLGPPPHTSSIEEPIPVNNMNTDLFLDLTGNGDCLHISSLHTLSIKMGRIDIRDQLNKAVSTTSSHDMLVNYHGSVLFCLFSAFC